MNETQHEISTAIIKLMDGVVYREVHEHIWLTLDRHHGAVQDHFAHIGVQVVINELEGFAYLKVLEPSDDVAPLPSLIQRRALTYNVSLLLLLLRKRLAEFEAGGQEGKLVLQRDQLVDMLRVFLAESTNETRVVKQVDNTINQIEKLGFISVVHDKTTNTGKSWEVKRILKAYVDAQTMENFATKLTEFTAELENTND